MRIAIMVIKKIISWGVIIRGVDRTKYLINTVKIQAFEKWNKMRWDEIKIKQEYQIIFFWVANWFDSKAEYGTKFDLVVNCFSKWNRTE